MWRMSERARTSQGRRSEARPRLGDHELRAWQALLHARHEVMEKLETELEAEHGLSLGDYDILVRLARAPERRLRMTELAKRVMVSPSGLTRMVDRLVVEGLVERERSDEDARVMLAHVSERGRALARRAARTHLRGIREHFTGRLSERELWTLATILETITGPHRPH
jgi:DNA-binding MarR family transcriptional regulator